MKSLPCIEVVSSNVHASWMAAKLAAGVTSRKLDTTGEELMVPYEQLSEQAKELDRGTVRAVYDAISTAAEPTSVAKLFDFGDALKALKLGARVARLGWNGKGMYLAHIPGGTTEQPNVNGGQAIEALPWIGLKTADDKFAPWQPSQADMLAEDWVVLEE